VRTVMMSFGWSVLSAARIGVACALLAHPPASAVRPARGVRATAVVTVLAKDFSFEMPDSLVAGWTTFRLRNDGTQPHHLILYRLDDGKTQADVMAALGRQTAYPTWMHAAGGPNASPHGSFSVSEVHLVPGTYIAFCRELAPDGTPHFAKGMVKMLTVVQTPRVAAVAPTADLEVGLVEYGFNFSGPVRAGRHVISVVNRGNQTHELIISQLAPLRTMADYTRWSATQQGPPPLVAIGGTTDLAPGGAMMIDITLPPGRYLARCRVLDTSDDRGHDLHGMSREFVVD
jgi:hypothetical protein